MSSIPLPTSPGIYQITCIPTGKIYIGSATKIRRRWAGHVSSASAGKHPNVHFQRAWNKYGGDGFRITVLELCECDQLIAREQHYLDTLRPFDPTIGFNIRIVAESALGIKRRPESVEKTASKTRGRKWSDAERTKHQGLTMSEEARTKISAYGKGRPKSEEHKAKIGKAHKGRRNSPEAIEKGAAKRRGRKLSAEHIAKMAEASRGRKHSEETKQKMSEWKRTPESIAQGAVKRTGKKITDEQRAKRMGHTLSDETRAKIAEKARGRMPSDETRAKNSQANKGRPKSEEHKAKIAAGRRGIKLSEEIKERMRQDRLLKKSHS